MASQNGRDAEQTEREGEGDRDFNKTVQYIKGTLFQVS